MARGYRGQSAGGSRRGFGRGLRVEKTDTKRVDSSVGSKVERSAVTMADWMVGSWLSRGLRVEKTDMKRVDSSVGSKVERSAVTMADWMGGSLVVSRVARTVRRWVETRVG